MVVFLEKTESWSRSEAVSAERSNRRSIRNVGVTSSNFPARGFDRQRTSDWSRERSPKRDEFNRKPPHPSVSTGVERVTGLGSGGATTPLQRGTFISQTRVPKPHSTTVRLLWVVVSKYRPNRGCMKVNSRNPPTSTVPASRSTPAVPFRVPAPNRHSGPHIAEFTSWFRSFQLKQRGRGHRGQILVHPGNLTRSATAGGFRNRTFRR